MLRVRAEPLAHNVSTNERSLDEVPDVALLDGGRVTADTERAPHEPRDSVREMPLVHARLVADLPRSMPAKAGKVSTDGDRVMHTDAGNVSTDGDRVAEVSAGDDGAAAAVAGAVGPG